MSRIFAILAILALVGAGTLGTLYGCEKSAREAAERRASVAEYSLERQREVARGLAVQEFELRDNDDAGSRVNRLNRAFGLCEATDNDCR